MMLLIGIGIGAVLGAAAVYGYVRWAFRDVM
jgi:hypothetical protein